MIALQLPQESPVSRAGRGGRGNHPEAGRGDARGQVGRSGSSRDLVGELSQAVSDQESGIR